MTFSDQFKSLSTEEQQAVVQAVFSALGKNAFIQKPEGVEDTLEIDITITEEQ